MIGQRPENPYHFFLELSADNRNPDHYQLLGIPQFTSDLTVIRDAAVTRNSQLRGWDNTDYHDSADELLDEVVAALNVLESPAAKAEYDRQLSMSLSSIGASASMNQAPLTVSRDTDDYRRLPPVESPAVNTPESVDAAPLSNNSREMRFGLPPQMSAGSVGKLLLVLLGFGLLAWWLIPSHGWGIIRDVEGDMEILIDNKPIPTDRWDLPVKLTVGSHTLVIRRDGTEVRRTFHVTAYGPPSILSTTGEILDLAETGGGQIPGEHATQVQLAWSKTLRVPVQYTNSIGSRFQLIPPGEFTMGTSNSTDESPAHHVRITRPFYLGTCEVTRTEYLLVMSGATDRDSSASNLPMTRISWLNATAFCERLSTLPAERTARHHYRLPTEAEWEYACRAGTDTKWSFGEDAWRLPEFAWCQSRRSEPAPVGRLKPNAWGLCDMHGNVSEWCQDWYRADYYQTSPLSDPSGPGASGYTTRVCRGGDWESVAESVRSAFRSANSQDVSDSPHVGVRVVLEIEFPAAVKER
ncbi:MAG: formylglycine-generating enzyme family protein [Planctomycetes bacterium]|nr:formylglycine-generating enzyme family protein [Planctomycetota bacterium]